MNTTAPAARPIESHERFEASAHAQVRTTNEERKLSRYTVLIGNYGVGFIHKVTVRTSGGSSTEWAATLLDGTQVNFLGSLNHGTRKDAAVALARTDAGVAVYRRAAANGRLGAPLVEQEAAREAEFARIQRESQADPEHAERLANRRDEAHFNLVAVRLRPSLNQGGLLIVRIGRFLPGTSTEYAAAWAIGFRQDVSGDRKFSTHRLILEDYTPGWRADRGSYDLTWDEALTALEHL